VPQLQCTEPRNHRHTPRVTAVPPASPGPGDAPIAARLPLVVASPASAEGARRGGRGGGGGRCRCGLAPSVVRCLRCSCLQPSPPPPPGKQASLLLAFRVVTSESLIVVLCSLCEGRNEEAAFGLWNGLPKYRHSRKGQFLVSSHNSSKCDGNAINCTRPSVVIEFGGVALKFKDINTNHV